MDSLFRMARAVIFSTPLLLGASIPVIQGCGGGDDCCRICSEGKACGDTCIAMSATCTISGGCACDD